MDTGVEARSEGQRMEQEAKQRESNEDIPATGPSNCPLTEENFMQYMQMMQEYQNKFMQEILKRIEPGEENKDIKVSLSYFQNAKPIPFASASEPMDAEDWLMDTERKLKTVGCNDEEKLRYATFLLSGSAANSWENQLAMHTPEELFTW